MAIETAFILAAGFGTRMGNIGKLLPKILWPVFEKTLLDLQVEYAKELGAKKIILNAHHLTDAVTEHIKGMDSVELVVEDEILGVGGAIHNLLHQGLVESTEKILILNGDQFYFVDEGSWKSAEKYLARYPVCLFAKEILPGEKYNRLVIEDGLLKDIIKNQQVTNEYTYSGMAVVDLSRLELTNGFSNFFDSVADYKNKEIAVIKPIEYEYWDFGTKKRYFDSMFRLLEITESNTKSKMSAFSIRTGAIDISKLLGKSYGAESGLQTINLSGKEITGQIRSSIVLSAKDDLAGEHEKQIHFQDFWEGLETLD